MNLNKFILFNVLSIFLFATSCSDSALDEINRDKDNPTNVPLSTLLPVVQTNTAYSVVGGDMSYYLAVHTQLVTGVHAQMHNFENLIYDNNSFQNTWNSTYVVSLKNLNIILSKSESQNAPAYKGVAQLLYAYNASVATDMWGMVPYSQAVNASYPKPAYDKQEEIYTGTNGLIALCDSAIVNLQKNSPIKPGADDLFYGGDLSKWIKAAYALKARFITRLSNTDYYDADEVIDAASKAFDDNSDALIFDAFSAGATSEHPWFQEENDRTHFAASLSLFNRMDVVNDPRMEVFFDEGAASNPAPNGTAQLDQGGDLYTKMYDYVEPNSPVEIITFDQLKFYEAEAHFRNGDLPAANTAYETAVRAALERYGIEEADIVDFISQPEVYPGSGSLTLNHIHEQLYISFYPFQSQEAFVELRRNDYPVITNPNGDLLKRLPWAQVELDLNSENNPGTPVTNGVWWDDLTDD